MTDLQVSETRDHFTRDGKAFFYLADTVWSAFTNITLAEWEEYLEYRRMQNFNVLQIDILPQWDASEADFKIEPFKRDARGRYDFSAINTEYFKRAQEMLDMATGKGFIPALVVLWCNYVKDTWAAKRNPENVIPLEAVNPYIEYVIKTFSRYNPIYIISGDTDFGSPETNIYYRTALETIKQSCPNALTTMHLSPPTDLPEEFSHSNYLDFYMYQSGHGIQEQDKPYQLATRFYGKDVKKPIVNGEPCYEGHGYGNGYGRFREFDVRKAIWQSLLAGAKAGVTYGAHGVWSWHKRGKRFDSEEFSSMPYDWRTALRLKGAWDASFARWIFEIYSLFDLEPANLIINTTTEIRMSVAPDKSKIAIYVPHNTDVRVNMDLAGYDWLMIDLAEKHFARPVVVTKNGLSTIRMHEFNSDVLLIGKR